jgi:hypothetical protein
MSLGTPARSENAGGAPSSTDSARATAWHALESGEVVRRQETDEMHRIAVGAAAYGTVGFEKWIRFGRRRGRTATPGKPADSA